MPEQKSTELKPDTKHHFWWYVLGCLLIPFLGIGIYIIYKKLSSLSALRYEITNHSIAAVDHKYSEKMDLINISSIDIDKRWIDEKFNIGTLLIRTERRTFRMIGMRNPDRLADMILSAAAAERMRIEALETETKPGQETQPGQIDRMDYLTGLWQQGLLSDEDFQKERKHFEP